MSASLFLIAQAVTATTSGRPLLPSNGGYTAAATYFRERVLSSLRDPKSADFGDVIVCSYEPDLKVGIVNVNAKNGYGGYTGYRALIVFDNPEFTKVLSADGHPTTEEEAIEQRGYVKLLEACGSTISAYDSDRRKVRP